MRGGKGTLSYSSFGKMSQRRTVSLTDTPPSSQAQPVVTRASDEQLTDSGTYTYMVRNSSA
ncbi:hypothetical protein KIN20_014554 [Parelaphostrongylus tenuis]|uniref:Uncharacterized protein n=1 Tax=Parelaphostrongylus tenuis TaxID=148309 RepID=A0AAD5QPD7_PARTN|nr:hypothetical protein KIN20_014554 [Parelaphostrongylus tenuis]